MIDGNLVPAGELCITARPNTIGRLVSESPLRIGINKPEEQNENVVPCSFFISKTERKRFDSEDTITAFPRTPFVRIHETPNST